MKTLKKAASVILALCLCAMMPFALAENAHEYMLGDIDGDKKITASDARMILRSSARLEDPLPLLQADADNNNEITASDARTILRKSAKLENLLYGYDENDLPNILATLRSGTYSIIIDISNVSLMLSMKDGMLYMPADSIMQSLMGGSGSADMSMMDSFITDMGILFSGKKMYLLFTDVVGFFSSNGNEGQKCYFTMDEDFLGEDNAEITSFVDVLSFPESEVYTETGTDHFDGEDCLVYSAVTGNGYTKELYMGYNAQLVAINYSGTKDSGAIPVSYITDDVSDEVFTLSDREFVDLEELLNKHNKQ